MTVRVLAVLEDGTELDEEIPNNLYQAVAEVLAFIYSINNKMLQPDETNKP